MPEEAVAVAEPEAAVQPDASQEASAPAPTQEAAPAPAAEPTPEGEQEQAPAELQWDDDTVGTILELGGDKLLEAPAIRDRIAREAQALADQRMAEQAGLPDHDAKYTELTTNLSGAQQARAQAAARLQQMVMRMQAGETVDPGQFAQEQANGMQAAIAEGYYTAASVAQAHRVTVGATLNELFGSDGALVIGKTKSGQPLTLDLAYDNAMRAYDSAIANGDPRAGPELVKQAIQIARAAALLQGERKGLAAKQAKETAATKAKENATINEIAAKVAAKRLGQTAPAVTGTPAPTLDTSKNARLQRLSFGGQMGSDGKLIPLPTEDDRRWHREYTKDF